MDLVELTGTLFPNRFRMACASSVSPMGKRAHGGESADAHGGNGGFGASGNHYIGVMVLDDAEGIADGVGAGGAGRGRRFIRALGAEAHGNVSGGEVDDGGRNEERRD